MIPSFQKEAWRDFTDADGRWHLALSAPEQALPSSFHGFFALEGAPVDRNRARHVVTLDLAGDCYLKRWAPVTLWHRLRHGAAPDPVGRELEGYATFARLGLPTPAIIAWGRGRLGSFLATRALESFAPLGKDLRARLNDRQRRALVLRLADDLGRLHGAGFCWPDCRARHVFARFDATAPCPPIPSDGQAPEGVTLAYLDLERVARAWPRRLHRDLASLAASVTEASTFEKVRFLAAYRRARFGALPDQAANRRSWWRKYRARLARLEQRARERHEIGLLRAKTVVRSPG